MPSLKWQRQPAIASQRPPRPSPRLRQASSPAAPDGGRGALATVNRRAEFVRRKTARQNRAVFCWLELLNLARRDGRFHVGRVDLLAEIGLQLVAIELPFPPQHHHAGDAVAA